MEGSTPHLQPPPPPQTVRKRPALENLPLFPIGPSSANAEARERETWSSQPVPINHVSFSSKQSDIKGSSLSFTQSDQLKPTLEFQNEIVAVGRCLESFKNRHHEVAMRCLMLEQDLVATRKKLEQTELGLSEQNNSNSRALATCSHLQHYLSLMVNR